MSNLISQVKDKILEAVKQTAESEIDYLVSQGWIEFPKKEIQGEGYTTENFKSGAEFGKIFARKLESRLEKIFKELIDET